MPSAPRRPVIGLTTYTEQVRCLAWDVEASLLPSTYVAAIIRSCGVPVLLPPVDHAADVVLGALDGLVLAGGGDLDAAAYGEAAHPANAGVRPARDAFELALLRAALDRDLPTLAVCRGTQLLNVALGGSLTQHLPDVLGHHAHRPAPGVCGPVQVRLAAHSRVARILGTEVQVLCQHHQALGRVAGDLDVVGWAQDGTVEAVELPGHTFVLGVQWHPEEDTTDDRLFAALITACVAR
ncbi:MAG: gamma-glutamyl-gamma-aminobutyrate hydrolase family protein [Pseudonocardiales bacterium]|nr:gamma-glutamyl-gamma-aminobutyrate hydrolase family protein [Pseudonocardiales bacterium]